jgi:hypothetical protein
MTEQLSKSARRRARKKRALQQPQSQPVPQVEAHEPEPDPGPGHGVPVTLQIPPRHMEVVNWMLKVDPQYDTLDEIMSAIVRQFIVSKLPDYREATNGGGSTVRRANFNPEA